MSVREAVGHIGWYLREVSGEEAEATCLVSVSLDLPVETVIEVTQPSTSPGGSGGSSLPT